MTERRGLTEGLKATPEPLDAGLVRKLVYADKSPPANQTMPQTAFERAPLSTRIRKDFTQALKRASLERQLEGVTPNTLQDILEEAVEPWLKSNGYIT
jgi:hypothetical protein